MIAELTSSGIGIEGVRRILELENRVAALRPATRSCVAELEATRDALRQALAARRTAGQPVNKLPVLRQPDSRPVARRLAPRALTRLPKITG